VNRFANAYIDNNHLGAQRVATRTLTTSPSIPQLARALADTAAGIQRWSRTLPSSVILGMILLATFAVCATVIMRTRAELQNSSDLHTRLNAEIGNLKKANDALRAEVGHLQKDPITIESAARSRLNMVRSNEIVVAIEAQNYFSKGESQSFVR
jgi:cell division protein FtsB